MGKRARDFSRKRKIPNYDEENGIGMEDLDDNEMRRFKNELLDDEAEMLPLKIGDTLVRRIKKLEKLNDLDEQNKEDQPTPDSDTNNPTSADKSQYEDLLKLSAIDRLVREKELLAAVEDRITAHVRTLLADPHAHIARLGDLLKLVAGERVHPAIRESASLLATSCAVEVFVGIVPGYAVRKMSQEERQQKMKKETRLIVSFEDALLMHYLHYLNLLEKNAKKLIKTKADAIHEGTFTIKLGMASARCLSKLLNELSHFNYATNLITCIVRLALTAYEPLLDVACDALANLFRRDVSLKNSLVSTRTISTCAKNAPVSPQLLRTLLSLNIRSVSKRNTEQEIEALKSKKRKIKAERGKKTANKLAKQLKQVQNDLKEADAVENLSSKLDYGTEVMKHVFAIYFRVLRKTPHPDLLPPVLAGLSKFSHLINIDFFDDLFVAFEELLSKKCLKMADGLSCIRTVCVVLSGEGVALNIDPLNFYRELYALLPALPFQQEESKYRLMCNSGQLLELQSKLDIEAR